MVLIDTLIGMSAHCWHKPVFVRHSRAAHGLKKNPSRVVVLLKLNVRPLSRFGVVNFRKCVRGRIFHSSKNMKSKKSCGFFKFSPAKKQKSCVFLNIFVFLPEIVLIWWWCHSMIFWLIAHCSVLYHGMWGSDKTPDVNCLFSKENMRGVWWVKKIIFWIV